MQGYFLSSMNQYRDGYVRFGNAVVATLHGRYGAATDGIGVGVFIEKRTGVFCGRNYEPSYERKQILKVPLFSKVIQCYSTVLNLSSVMRIGWFHKFLEKWPGKKTLGMYRFLPMFFVLGAALEFSMINWKVGEINFYNTFKKRQAHDIVEDKIRKYSAA